MRRHLNDNQTKRINRRERSTYAPADTSPSGTDKTFTLPAADGTVGQVLSTNGSGVLSFANAIAEVDQWYLTNDVTATGMVTSSDVQRSTFQGTSQIGTGMSVSNEVWTFPSTGKWLLIFNCLFNLAAGDNNVKGEIQVSTNGTNYSVVAITHDGNNSSSDATGAGTAFFLFDVKDTTNHLARFKVESVDSGSALKGDSGRIETSLLFIRLGDT